MNSSLGSDKIGAKYLIGKKLGVHVGTKGDLQIESRHSLRYFLNLHFVYIILQKDLPRTE